MGSARCLLSDCSTWEEQNDYIDIDDGEEILEDDINTDDSDDIDSSDQESTNDYSNNDIAELPGQQSWYNNYFEKQSEHSLMQDSKEFIYNLLQRARSLINAINHSSNLDKYVRDQIVYKQQDSDKRSKEDNSEPIVYYQLVVDFRCQWNSTFKMLNRFILLSSIINEVTFTPKNIDGVTSSQVLKLSKLAFSHDDWNLLSALELVLQRFEESTRLISSTTYQTPSLEDKKFIKKAKQLIASKSKSEKFISTYPSTSNSTPLTRSLLKIIKKSLLTIESFLSNCEAPLPS
ncbi:unnamed protein product [Rotaria magnacalcarata]